MVRVPYYICVLLLSLVEHRWAVDVPAYPFENSRLSVRESAMESLVFMVGLFANVALNLGVIIYYCVRIARVK